MIYINQPLVRLLLHICYQSTVNMISLAQVWAAQWSNTIPSWNVWLQVKIHLTLFCFNTSTKPMICLGCNKDLWSWRSKYKSYGALRGCDLGVRDCLQVCCGQLYLFFQQCFWQLPNQLPRCHNQWYPTCLCMEIADCRNSIPRSHMSYAASLKTSSSTLCDLM